MVVERAELDSDVAGQLIAALNSELSAAYPEQGATHFRLDPDEVSGDRGGFFVAWVNGEAVGCGALRMVEGDAAELKRMFVLAEHRGHGYGAVVLEHLIEEARALGATRVVLETGVRQQAALGLYRRAGFAEIAPYGEYVGSPLSVCMERSLRVEATVVKPPRAIPDVPGARYVFLAGSIDMGVAEDWQTRMSAALAAVESLIILNPRRDAWDSSWTQSITNPQFREQVEWELDGMERADVIAMYFAPQSKAPITLLELGLHARTSKLIVCCPDGYWRKGNVEVVCARHDIERVDTFDELIAAVIARLG